MTEADWNSCTEPQAMLAFLRDSDKLSERKARLFAVACCRGVWHLLRDKRSRYAVDTGERFADGLSSWEELRAAQANAQTAADTEAFRGNWFALLVPTLRKRLIDSSRARRYASHSAVSATGEPTMAGPGRGQWEVSRTTCWQVSQAAFSERAFLGKFWGGNQQKAVRRQVGLLHCIFGPLAFRPVALPLSVRAWHDRLIQRLAEAAYENRLLPSGHLDPDRIALLNDALEEAGADAEIVEHLRQPGAIHVRGCWAVDLALGT